MFGIHGLFGDYADAIQSTGGRLARVVLNMEEPVPASGPTFRERLARYETWLRSTGENHAVEVLPLHDYQPRPGEHALFGFRGPKLRPLLGDLRTRFGLHFPPLVHARASVSPMARLDEGVFIGAGTVVAPGVRVGEFTLLNRGALIGHDVEIGPCNIIGPGANFASHIRTEEGAVVGIGAILRENITLGAGCSIAAGAVVLHEVPSHTLVAGVPAVVKKSLPTP
jgi:carbonic anhydrase/acetyltransferase-like protein (isoleucine patch superfamily)